MHIMYNLYLPVEGKYTKGWGSSAFSGPVQVAENFASMSTSAGAAIIARKPAAEAAEMQKRFNKQVDAQARAAGATPISGSKWATAAGKPLNSIPRTWICVLSVAAGIWFSCS